MGLMVFARLCCLFMFSLALKTGSRKVQIANPPKSQPKLPPQLPADRWHSQGPSERVICHENSLFDAVNIFQDLPTGAFWWFLGISKPPKSTCWKALVNMKSQPVAMRS